MNVMVMRYGVFLYVRKINSAEVNRTNCFRKELCLYKQMSGVPGTVQKVSNIRRSIYIYIYFGRSAAQRGPWSPHS